MYRNQIIYHEPFFNLFILHDNLFDNQGSKINKNDIFCVFRHTAFYENSLCIYIYSRKKVFVKDSMSKRKKMSFLFISLP